MFFWITPSWQTLLFASNLKTPAPIKNRAVVSQENAYTLMNFQNICLIIAHRQRYLSTFTYSLILNHNQCQLTSPAEELNAMIAHATVTMETILLSL